MQNEQDAQKRLYIVGLGPGSPEDISVGALNALRCADSVILRTVDHPVKTLLDGYGIAHTSCGDIYDSAKDPKEAGLMIVERVMEALWTYDRVAYAVPGHPLVFENTVSALLDRCKTDSIPCRVLGSLSCLEATISALGLDLSTGFESVDAMRLGFYPIDGRTPLLVVQLYSPEVASDIKRILGAKYGLEHRVSLVRAAGVHTLERIARVELKDIDSIGWVDRLTTMYVPACPKAVSDNSAECEFPLDRLVSVIKRLRGDAGCPWDREQTHRSLRPYALEEAYEVAEAIELEDANKLCEELGDLLLQIVLHAQIGTENGTFDANDVVAAITEKMVRRHPHVFSNAVANTPEEVEDRWEQIKQAERGGKKTGALGKLPGHLPALMQASKLGHKARAYGFDWPDARAVFEKVEEEIRELRSACACGCPKRIESELGDVLFSVVNLARHLDVDPEVALSSTVSKFVRRFEFIERTAREAGRVLRDMSLEEMDDIWNDAKKAGL